MAKGRPTADKGMASQPGLFDTAEEGSLDIVLGLKQLLSRVLKGHDRYLAAAQISKMTLKDISKDALDKYLSSDPAYQPSALLVTAICKITGSLEPFRYLLEPLDADVVPPEDRDLVEMARLSEERRRIDARLQQLQSKRGMR